LRQLNNPHQRNSNSSRVDRHIPEGLGGEYEVSLFADLNGADLVAETDCSSIRLITYPVQLLRRIKAVFRQSLRDFPTTGLLRNATAPAASTCVRVVWSGRPVIKIVGTAKPSARRRRWSSTPVKPGICKSVIRQDVSVTRFESRKKSSETEAAAAARF
jgi:hypothetical protein